MVLSPLATYFAAPVGGDIGQAILGIAFNSCPQIFDKHSSHRLLETTKAVSTACLPLLANVPKNYSRRREWSGREKKYVDYEDRLGRLYYAAVKKNTERVLALLDAEADHAATDIRGTSTLEHAIYKKAPLEIVEPMLRAAKLSPEEAFHIIGIAAYFSAPASVLRLLLAICKEKVVAMEGPVCFTILHRVCTRDSDHSFIPDLLTIAPHHSTFKQEYYMDTPLDFAIMHNIPLPYIKMIVEAWPPALAASTKKPKDPASELALWLNEVRGY